MSNANRQMAALSRELARLEHRLGELAGRLADMKHILGPLLGRYRREVLRYHRRLVETQRQIADLRLLAGDANARAAGDAVTPLSRLIALEQYASVEEQYERVWKGKRPPRPEDVWEQEDMPPASDELKALYGEVAAATHPALARSPQDYERRRTTFRRASEAYVARSQHALEAVARTFRDRSNLPAVVDEHQVARLRRQAAALELLIVQLEGQVYDLRHGDVAKVMAYALAAQRRGVDLFAQLNDELREELARAADELARIRARIDK